MMCNVPIAALAPLALLLLLPSTSSQSTTTTTTPSLDAPFQSSNFNNLVHQGCTTLVHRSGRIGCGTSSRETQSGRLLYWENLFSLGSLSSDEQMEHYVVVFPEADYSSANVEKVLEWKGTYANYLQGFLVVNGTEGGYYPTPDSLYPQGQDTPSANLTYSSDYAWNGDGDSLVFKNLYGFPTALVQDSSISSSLVDLSKQQTLGVETIGPAVAEFNYYMGPESITSKQCLEWKNGKTGEWEPKCLPVGGLSVWATHSDLEEDNQKDVLMLAVAMDGTSMFHDVSPAAHTAASNILTLLLTANILGNVDPEDLSKQIAFGFFQGENWGYLGSRSFLKDVNGGFECENVAYKKANSDGEQEVEGCLYPLRPSLEFQNLGEIAGMIAVDQVAHLVTDNTVYMHGEHTYGGGFMANIMNNFSTAELLVSTTDDEDNNYPIPSSPLDSLLELSGGTVGGIVLTGYGNTFAENIGYNSHQDSQPLQNFADLNAIVSSAILLARTALAVAYDDGGQDMYTDTAYAYEAIPDDIITTDDEIVLTLYNCLYINGNCDFLMSHSATERKSDAKRTGYDMGGGSTLGNPPTYYTDVFDQYHSQPFVQVQQTWYGAYKGDEYGQLNSDNFLVRPNALESGLKGILNDFLGRPVQDDVTYKSCRSDNDCQNVDYCNNVQSVCTGAYECVCSRAHYHTALDEAIEAAADEPPGRFQKKEDEDGISPMYTEPYWSSDVGVTVYRDAGENVGIWALLSGIMMLGGCITLVGLVKRRMKKENLY